jgi:hypothetical protein
VKESTVQRRGVGGVGPAVNIQDVGRGRTCFKETQCSCLESEERVCVCCVYVLCVCMCVCVCVCVAVGNGPTSLCPSALFLSSVSLV